MTSPDAVGGADLGLGQAPPAAQVPPAAIPAPVDVPPAQEDVTQKLKKARTTREDIPHGYVPPFYQ